MIQKWATVPKIVVILPSEMKGKVNWSISKIKQRPCKVKDKRHLDLLSQQVLFKWVRTKEIMTILICVILLSGVSVLDI